MQGLIEGYRVLDLTEGGCLLCGKILAELGADVIKIERPGGSPSRKVGPFYKDIPHPKRVCSGLPITLTKGELLLTLRPAMDERF